MSDPATTRGLPDMPLDWIARHALAIWALLLVVALLGTDAAWRRAMRRRDALDPATRTWLRPSTAITVVVVALLLATAIAVEVREEAGLTVFDAALASDLRASLSRPVLRAIAWVTHAGDGVVIGAAAAIVFVVLLLRRHGRLAITWLVTLVGTALINTSLKQWFQRERPFPRHPFVVEHTYSFPSGHASGSMVFYGMLAYVLLVLCPPRWHRWIVIVAAAMITIIGISRILLQVHYFSDVVAGYATGLAWLTLCVGSAEVLRLRQGRRALS